MAQIKLAVYTFDNTISTDCPIDLRSSESNNFKDFQVVDTVDGNITHRTIYVSNDVVITRMRIYYQPSLLTVEYMRIDENITNCDGLVANAEKLTYINTDNWDTKNVKNMSSMFVGCESLTDLNLAHLDTSQVEDMRMMFWGCKSLQNLNVTGWDTSKVDDMYGMFAYCTMTTLDISSFDTSSVTEYDFMFAGFSSTQSVYVSKKWTLGTSGFDATITNTFTYTLAKYTFNNSVADCLPTITGATTSQWGYSDKVDGTTTTRTIGTDEELTITNISFRDKKSLLTLDYLNFTNAITNTSNMFNGCSGLTSVKALNWDTSNVKNMSSMFNSCRALTSLNISTWNTSAVTNMSTMFNACSKLTTLDLSGWNTSAVTSMNNMFLVCVKLTTLDLSGFNVENVTNMNMMFYGCSSLTSLNISTWNTSKVSNMNAMFQSCSKLTTLDVSHWKVDKVANMSSMFNDCSSLKALDLSSWNTSAVTSMSKMFNSCSSLTSLNISTWNTSAVSDMSSMFQSCTSLTTLDLSHWKVDKVANMNNVFYSCSVLTTLDLSNWDTSAVTSMNNMFYGCKALTSIDLSNFNTSKVTSMSELFFNCDNLTILDISNFDTSNVTTWGNFSANKLTNIGLIYASSSTINSIVTKWLGTSVARNVYYIDAEPSELTTQTNITYIPYSQSILSCSEEITLRSNGDVYDELDLLTGQVIQRIGEDNEILEEEIVRTIELDGEISFYENSYIHTSSNEITPKFEFQPTLTNCYTVSDLKPNTQYTVLFEGNPTLMYLGGTTIENPVSKIMITSGEVDNILWFDTSVSKIMILEGDLTNRDVEYFTGVKSSQKIEIQLCAEGFPIFGKGGKR